MLYFLYINIDRHIREAENRGSKTEAHDSVSLVMNDPRPNNAAATFDFSIDDNPSILGGSGGDDPFLSSLESGGALLSMAGHWSTADGSMQWTGGKEELFDPWSTAGPGAASDTRGCTPASNGVSGLVKPDPGGAWLSALMVDPASKTSGVVTNSQLLPAGTPTASVGAPNKMLRPYPRRHARDGVIVKDEVVDTEQQQQQQQHFQQPPGMASLSGSAAYIAGSWCRRVCSMFF